MNGRILMLYRPELPGQRAQTIQVLHMARAFAERGFEVTVLGNRRDRTATPQAALRALGISACPGLHVQLAPARQRGVAGAWFRLQAYRWSRGQPGVVFARDLERLVDGATWWRDRHRVVLEVHGRTSGDAGAPASAFDLEQAALRLAGGVVANCEGTADEWRETHGGALPGPIVVQHNGTAAGRRRAPVETDGVVRAVGSLRAFKGWHTLAEAARMRGVGPIELVGGRRTDLPGVDMLGLAVREAVPFPEVPDLLASSSVLVLPLSDNRFGRILTSPLKLFDYLATGVPLVLPDLPSISHALLAAGADASGLERYQPGNAASLARAIRRARRQAPRSPVMRTWQHRADALIPLLFPPSSPLAPLAPQMA